MKIFVFWFQRILRFLIMQEIVFNFIQSISVFEIATIHIKKNSDSLVIYEIDNWFSAMLNIILELFFYSRKSQI